MSPQNAELEPKLQKYKGRVALRGDTVKDDSGAYAVFTETRLVCVPDDSCKNDGRHRQIARVRRKKQLMQCLLIRK